MIKPLFIKLFEKAKILFLGVLYIQSLFIKIFEKPEILLIAVLHIKSLFMKLFEKPKILFIGVLMGLILCSIIGRMIASSSYYTDFVRLGGGLATRGISFQVTASQISGLIRKTCTPDQVLVIAGGSSVFYGSGQPTRYLWTKKLQEKLGKNYCVFNLAAPAGELVGYASVALEMVGSEYKNAFLVTDASAIPRAPADGQIWYKHFFWDAYYKGLLDNSPVDYSSERIKAMHAAMSKSDSKTKERSEQIEKGMWLDGILYFNDLWTFIHYSFVQTVYDPGLGPWNWGPLRPVTDYDYEISEEKIHTLKHYPAPGTAQFLSEFNLVRSYTSAYFKATPNGRLLDEKLLNSNNEIVKNHPLTDMAEHIIIVSIPESPYYTERMTKKEQHDYMVVRNRLVDIWKKNGYTAFYMGGFKPYDYGDRSHLNTLGGWKLAEKVSKKIQNLTRLP